MTGMPGPDERRKRKTHEKSSFAKTMEMLNMDESTKHLLDITSVFTAVGSLLSWLPTLSFTFYYCMAWSSHMGNCYCAKDIRKRRVAKTKKAINDARKK
jgi:hypothetical protein